MKTICKINNYDFLKELKPNQVGFSCCDTIVTGVVPMKQLLAIPHKGTSAGSNPREFLRIKSKTNQNILTSMVSSCNTQFTALNQGVCISVVGAKLDDNCIEFEDACIVNGLQTVSLGRILVVVKLYQLYQRGSSHGIQEIHTKISNKSIENWHSCIDSHFSTDFSDQLHSISLDEVNSILTWIHKEENKKILNNLNNLSLSSLLELPVVAKFVLVDDLLKEIGNECPADKDIMKKGIDIAEANNDTQRVETSDLFGIKRRDLMESYLFSKIEFPIKIAYGKSEHSKLASLDKTSHIVHILDALRCIIPTTLITPVGVEPVSFVAKYASHREKVYAFFEQLFLSIDNNCIEQDMIKDTFSIINSIIPQLLEAQRKFDNHWNYFKGSLTEKIIIDDFDIKLAETYLKENIYGENKATNEIPLRSPDIQNKIDSEIRRQFRFSDSSAFPIFVYSTKSEIRKDKDGCYVYDVSDSMLETMVTIIFEQMIRYRIRQRYSSTSDMYRDKELYLSCARDYRNLTRGKDYLDYTDTLRLYVGFVGNKKMSKSINHCGI